MRTQIFKYEIVFLAASWESSSQSSSQRNRKRKSGSSKTSANSGSPRKNKSVDGVNTTTASLAGTAVPHSPSAREASNHPKQLHLNRSPTAAAVGRGTASSKQSTTPQQADRSAGGAMYEENELYLTQFTPDGGKVPPKLIFIVGFSRSLTGLEITLMTFQTELTPERPLTF